VRGRPKAGGVASVASPPLARRPGPRSRQRARSRTARCSDDEDGESGTFTARAVCVARGRACQPEQHGRVAAARARRGRTQRHTARHGVAVLLAPGSRGRGNGRRGSGDGVVLDGNGTEEMTAAGWRQRHGRCLLACG
jgi:hypothetical protein